MFKGKIRFVHDDEVVIKYDEYERLKKDSEGFKRVCKKLAEIMKRSRNEG